MTTASAGTSRRSAPNGRDRSRRAISTSARSRSTAAPTRSRRTSSPRRSWGSDMDFDLSEEQRLLKDSVERLLADHYAFEARKRLRQEPGGWSRAMWQRYAELGLLGLPFDEEHGGIGGGPVETMIVMEAFGRALALEPYLRDRRAGRRVAAARRQRCMRADLLPKIASGELISPSPMPSGRRATISPMSRRPRARRRRLRARRRQEPGAARRQRRQVHRLGAACRRPARPRRHRAVSWSTPHAEAVARGYPTGRRPARRRGDAEPGVRVARCVIGEPGAAFPLIERVADRRWRRSPPKRSAPWRRCTSSPSTI